ncbi:MAG TPA: hypothetical protein VGL45_09850 [Bradyrhizobium sp.]|jgi:hypothetical protein
MNTKRLYEILAATTAQFRQGAEVEEHIEGGGLKVREIYAMPHESEAPADIEKVDMVFLTIGVDKPAAEKYRQELLALLADYPRLKEGPSYIEVGAEIGDQGAAFQLFALGKVLGLWDVITPQLMGFEGDEAREMAGRGFIMCSGLRVAA